MRILLVLIFVFVASSVLAVPVDPNAPGGVAAFIGGGRSVSLQLYALCVDGQVLQLDFHSNLPPGTFDWVPTTEIPPLPVPVREMRDWELTSIRTWSGDYYFTSENPDTGAVEWRHAQDDPWVPPLPCGGAVGGDSEVIDSLKSMFR